MMSVNDEESLRNIVSGLEAAWNSGDSVAWSGFFAEDADFIHILGGHFNGRAAIERGHRAIFDTIYKGSTNKYTVKKVRFVGPGTAIVFILAELKVSQEGLPPVLHARPTMVAQETPNGWQIVAFQNTMITTETVSAENNRLSVGVSTALNDAIGERHPIKGTVR